VVAAVEVADSMPALFEQCGEFCNLVFTEGHLYDAYDHSNVILMSLSVPSVLKPNRLDALPWFTHISR